uniref:Uncharacterized protein n=1 Tax=Amblyomma parvum TaxID=251391 RepID=A0A023G2L3_AMBPA
MLRASLYFCLLSHATQHKLSLFFLGIFSVEFFLISAPCFSSAFLVSCCVPPHELCAAIFVLFGHTGHYAVARESLMRLLYVARVSLMRGVEDMACTHHTHTPKKPASFPLK